MMLNVSKHLLLEPCLGADFFLPRAKDKLPPSALLSLEVGPLNTARGLEERCKLPQLGLERSPGRKRTGHFEHRERVWWQKNC